MSDKESRKSTNSTGNKLSPRDSEYISYKMPMQKNKKKTEFVYEDPSPLPYAPPRRKTRADGVSGLSWPSLVKTSFEFCLNSLRKKSKEFQMSMITVFLTVAFITLIDCLSGIIAVPPL